MVAYLSKSDVSEGLNQIIDFLNGSSIKYALTVNPNIFVSCIKQFWTTVAVKKVNDVTRLQALVDKKKVVVTKATTRDAPRLDNAEGVECLPNEEIFVELARMGYEKPSTKLTFYKAFFSSQWKFLIHTILQCMSVKRTSWNEFSSSMASTVICLSLAQEIGEGVADEVHDEGVPTAGVVTEGVVSVADDVVPTADEEPSIPSPTPPTPPPQPSQYIPSTSKVKKLEKRNKVKVLTLRRLQKVRTAQRIDTYDDTVMDDVSNQGTMIADMDADADVVLEEAKDVAADAKDGQDAEEEESEPAELKEVVDIVTTAKIIIEVVTAGSTTITATDVLIFAATIAATPCIRTKGVVIRDPEESTTTTSIIIHSEAKSKDKEAELNRNIDWDEVIDHVNKKAKEDPAVKRYQALKRKPQTEAQARKNMMIYLKNVSGFKMEYFKGIALKRINKTPAEKATKRQKLDEEVEELKRHLQIVHNEDDDVYTEAIPLARKVPVVDYEIYNQTNKPYYKIKRADERKYLLTKFTLNQMLYSVRLEVEEDSEVSLDLLSFGVDAAMEFKEKYAKCLMLLVKDLVLSIQDEAIE
uniref:Xylulose kinase-1 n=1 Tax=Tanacetum cinerariifolium TaxID=118510 RepID=A0A6L2N3G4_TANCI|nr:hypothetical protein [Tanacetum cinerariifolium]